MRAKVSQLLRGARRTGLAAALGIFALGHVAAAETVTLSRNQALVLASHAVSTGDLVLANVIANRLLEGDPEDVQALMVLAATEPALGRAAYGRSMGRKAWAASRGRPTELRYNIARLTAKAALVEGRPALAQFWLRRAMDVAPNPQAVAQTGQDFQNVRARTPLHWKLDLQVSPSSNINGGSDVGLLIVDEYYIGTLGGWSEAKSGLLTTLDAEVLYALPPSANGQYILGMHADATQYRLSASAQAASPELDASVLNRTTVELLLRREQNRPGSKLPLSMTLTFGQSWQGGYVLGPHLRAEARTALVLRNDASLWLSGTLERQWQQGGLGRADALQLQLSGTKAVPALAGQVNVSLGATAARADYVNSNYNSVNLRLGYAPKKTIAGAEIAVALNTGWRGYDRFSLGFAEVTRGRTDESWGATLDVVVPKLSIMGFAPDLTLTHQTTSSNISRYSGTQTSIALGIRSNF